MLTKLLYLSLLLLLITGCENTEKQARILLNEAIKEWDSGNIKSAEEKFELIDSKYFYTVAGTDSIKERTERKQKYANKYDIRVAKEKNKGSFSKQVIDSIDDYFQANKIYPEDLASINLYEISANRQYLLLCNYEKALFNYGYKLDCINSDIEFNKNNRVVNNIAKSSNRKVFKNKIQKISDFPKANSTWGDKLNPSGDLPEKGFLAFYINTNSPEKVIKKELVNDVSINYAYDDFQNIHSKDFGGYWVGNIHLQKDEVKRVAINQSWSKARLIIDGAIVYEGGSDKEILIYLTKGTHRIEVEYINNWHTTEFSVIFIERVELLSINDIKTRLTENILGKYELHYAGIYESSSKDLSVTIQIKKSPKQIVLFLNSHRAVKWQISNPFMTDIRAIVYGSNSPGTTISGDINKATMILASEQRIGSSYTAIPRCNCISGHFNCSGSNMLSTKKFIERLSDAKMTGFSGKYSASSLPVPQIIVNERYAKELELHKNEVAKLREACKQKKDPDFEKLFDRG